MLCRLCFYEFNDEYAGTQLFENGKESTFIKLIAKYLYIEVRYDETSTTAVCGECVQHLNSFHEFFKHIEERQSVFRELSSNQNNATETEIDLKYTQNNEETPVDLLEYIPLESDEQLAPETEFAYADIVVNANDENTPNKSDDEDDEPLGNLILSDKRVTNYKSKSKSIKQSKRNATKKKSNSLKAKRNRFQEGSDDKPNDNGDSIKGKNYAVSAEEDQMRDDLIAKHIQLKCEICGLCMSSYKELTSHFRLKHNRKSYITCCGKRFKQRFLLVDHINWHLNPDHFKCKICGKIFKSRVAICIHMANKHSDREQMRYGCEICSKKFAHQSLLTTHMFVHTQERNHVCETCKKAFKSVHMLNAHIRHMHGEKAPYVCESCGKEYRFKPCFDRHIAEHQGQAEQREQCPICQQWFSTNYLQRHIKRHELADVDCEKCGKTFKSKAALSSHMEYSHRTKRNYACHLCDKTFERTSNLKEHIDMHTGNKAYNCAYCPRDFRSRANMYAHVKKIHHEQWAQTQNLRNQGPNPVKNLNNNVNNTTPS